MKKYVLVEGYALGDVRARAAQFLGLPEEETGISYYCLDGGWQQTLVSKVGDEMASDDAWNMVGCNRELFDISFDDDRNDIIFEKPVILEDGSELIGMMWGYDSEGIEPYEM